MTPEQIKARIEGLAPGTEVAVTDLTGTQDHYQIEVVSSVFKGKSLLDQHRMVQALLKAEMATNEVHAIKLKTRTPEGS